MIPNENTAAVCGLFCGNCPCYPESCHGCLSDKLTAHCVTCPNGFRDCTRRHGVTRCYECGEFPCQRLQTFSGQHWENGIGHHATVIPDLQRMGEIGINRWVAEKTAACTCPRCGCLIPWMDRDKHQCIGGKD